MGFPCYNDLAERNRAHEAGVAAEREERYEAWRAAQVNDYLQDPQGINSIVDALVDEGMADAIRDAAAGSGETFVAAYQAAISRLFSWERFEQAEKEAA